MDRLRPTRRSQSVDNDTRHTASAHHPVASTRFARVVDPPPLFRRLLLLHRLPTLLLCLFFGAPFLHSLGNAASPTRDDAPPAFPDTAHVPEGCLISTLAYLARFQLSFPDETGQPLTVALPGRDLPHTIALVSWRGQWWARDEYSGAFALRLPVRGAPDTERLRTAAEASLQRLSVRQLRFGRIAPQTERSRTLSTARRCQAVATAADLLPCTSRLFWVRSDGTELPFLFFEPTAGHIAVYDPASGTATAECAASDPQKIVSLVATRLGYMVEAVRAAEATPHPSQRHPLPEPASQPPAPFRKALQSPVLMPPSS